MATCPAASRVPAPGLVEDWRGYPAGSHFSDGTAFGPWVSRFNGLGTVSIVDDPQLGPQLELSPKASATAGETHAGLVTTAASFGDFDATIVMLTLRQLRTPTPNGWESGWILWRYVDRAHFYYLTLNARGWELGKEDASRAPARRFLITGATPALVLGRPNVIRIVQRGDTFSVFADSRPIVQFTDYEEPYQTGALGLYCEDSIVRFGRIDVAIP